MSLGRWLRGLFGGEETQTARAEGDPAGRTPPEAAWDDALFAALRDDPDDDARFAVLADWLIERGDPRGELIAAMRGGDGPHAWLQRFPEHLLGPAHARGWEVVASDAPIFAWDAYLERPAVRASWRSGFIDRLRVQAAHEAWGAPGASIDELVALASNPSCHVLRELVFGGAMWEGLPAGLPVFPTVKRVRIGEFFYPDECEMSWSELGSWIGVAERFPGLRELTVQGGLAGIDLPPGVSAFRWETSNASGAVVREILSQLDGARSIALWTGASDYGADVSVEDLEPLLDRELEHLGVQNSELSDAFAARLPGSRVLRGLRTLDLSLGTLGEDGARTLLRHADAFAHLERLNLDGNGLVTQVDALRAAFGDRVSLANQERPDDGLYVSVAE